MGIDVYQMVTDRIIAMLEQGIIPWEKPWAGMAGGARNYVTQRPYSLMNQLLLGGDGEWMSMKQCNERGGKVKKGSKAHMVVFWKVSQYEDRDSAGHIKTDSKVQNDKRLIVSAAGRAEKAVAMIFGENGDASAPD